MLGHGKDILVAPAGKIDHHQAVGRQGGGKFHGVGHGMRGFQRGNNALQPGAELEGFQRLPIGGPYIFSPPDIVQPCVFRPTPG